MAANITGTEKPAFSYWEISKPALFAEHKIFTCYKSNCTVWITSNIFEEILQHWDKGLKLKKLK